MRVRAARGPPGQAGPRRVRTCTGIPCAEGQRRKHRVRVRNYSKVKAPCWRQQTAGVFLSNRTRMVRTENYEPRIGRCLPMSSRREFVGAETRDASPGRCKEKVKMALTKRNGGPSF